MKKSELIAAIAEKGGFTKKESEAMLKLFTETVTEALANGEKVSVAGFGVFNVTDRAARDTVNPATKKVQHIEARKAPVFKASKALKEAEKPLICLGGGVFASGAVNEIRQLARTMNIPVINTMMGISAFPNEDPLYFGMLGMHGVKTANQAVKDCDTLFLVGARVGDRAVRTPVALQKTTKIIHIDIDPAEIGKNMGVDIPLVGDARQVLTQLLAIAEPKKHDAWIAQLNEYRTEKTFSEVPEGTVNPKEFIYKLSKAMPDDTVICADVGQNQIWTCTNYSFADGGRLVTSGGMGTMGYSLPAAIGAKLAQPERTVAALCGDGSLQMSMMELATAVQHDVPVKVVVMTNTRLGMVRELQTNGYNDRQTAVFLDGSPDFVKLAESYGIPAMRVTDDKTAADDIKVFRCVRNPMGELVYLGYDFEIKDGKKTVYEYSYKYVYAGEYKFMIYAIDEAGNQQMVSYTVVVG